MSEPTEPASQAEASGTRWGRAGEEAPGGTAMTDSGQINLERFSIGPETDLEVTWWNKKLVWQVRREPTGHEVVVVRALENVWRIHILIAGVAIVLGMLGLIFIAGLSPLWALLLGVALGGSAYALLLLEQKIGSHRVGIQDAFVLDARIWRGVVTRSERMILNQTKAGQKAVYSEAVKYYRERHEAKYGDPDTGKVGKKWVNPATGRLEKVPKFEVPEAVTEFFLNEDSRLSPDSVAERISELLSASGRARAATNLRNRYRKHPKQAEAMGRGVLQCGCVACQFNAENNVRPALFGAEARRRSELAEAKRMTDRGQDPALLSNPIRRMVLTRVAELSGAAKAPAAEPVDRPVRAEPEPVRQTAPVIDEPAIGDEVDTEGSEPGRKKWLIAAGALVVVAGVALGGLMMLSTGSSEPEETGPEALLPPTPTSVEPTTSAEPTPTSTEPEEPPVPEGEVAGEPLVFGPGDPGGRDGGAELIAAYEYFYYVDRDPEAARELYVPEARGDVQALRNGIEANPRGTGYRLTVTPVVPGQEYDIDLLIEWPGMEPGQAAQKFFTTYIDGEFYILRSEARE